MLWWGVMFCCIKRKQKKPHAIWWWSKKKKAMDYSVLKQIMKLKMSSCIASWQILQTIGCTVMLSLSNSLNCVIYGRCSMMLHLIDIPHTHSVYHINVTVGWEMNIIQWIPSPWWFSYCGPIPLMDRVRGANTFGIVAHGLYLYLSI